MKTLYTLITILALVTSANAKTYVASASGKWNDVTIWNNDYPGTTIAAGDEVIVKGNITLNTSLVIEGTLTLEKGGMMVSNKDVVIAKSGKFNNNGNLVSKSIINEGELNNAMLVESMGSFENKGTINNNSMAVAGTNFANYGGTAQGNNGAYFVNNNVQTSPAAKFGDDVKVFFGNSFENLTEEASTSMKLNAAYTSNGVELTVANPKNETVANFSIEKSNDGKTYTTVNVVVSNNGGMTYVDNSVNHNLVHYRVKAYNAAGEEVVLPTDTVKAPVSSSAYSMVTE